jgi:hypothetical protein
MSTVTFRHVSRGLTAEMPSKDRYIKQGFLKGLMVFRCVLAALIHSTDKQTSCVPAERALACGSVAVEDVAVEDEVKISTSVRS